MKNIKLFIFVAASGLASLGFAAESMHWEYSGEAGPEHWGALDPSFGQCSSGKNQSPIDIKDIVQADLSPIKFAYEPGGNEIVNNGHTVQVNFANGGQISINENIFALKQFHFHVPSENLVQGKSFPMEVHFVHADASGNLAVIAVFFEEGVENSTLARVWKKMPGKINQKKTFSTPLQADSLMPYNKDYYRFSGSLTTPPCTEGVYWFVMKNPIVASKAQINALLKVLHHANNRPVQPINARLIAQ